MYCTGLMCYELLRQNSQSTLLKIETPAAKKNAKPVANIFLNGANIHLNIKMFWLNYLSYILRATKESFDTSIAKISKQLDRNRASY